MRPGGGNVKTQPDEAIGKGAVEDSSPEATHKPAAGQSSLSGQLGHRDQDDLIKENDSDFPEPGAREEHTGE
jgi:hypothetical protein